MAADARADRQLMRQRGAGTRNINTTDLELDFNGGSRQERQLMRQRGAGNRQIENINFGFSFPTPTRSPRSKTPRSVTPRRSSREHSHLSHGSRHSRQPSLPPLVSEIRDGIISDPARRLSKRRRLSQVSNVTVPRSDLANLQSVRDYQIPIADAEAEQQDFALDRQDVFDTAPSSPLFVPRSDADKENAWHSSHPLLPGHAAEANKPVAKKRKRKSIGQQSLRKKKRSSNQSVQSTSLDAVEETHDVPVPIPPLSALQPPQNSDIVATLPQEPSSKPRRKRKSITYNTARKKRRSSGNSTQALADVVEDDQVHNTPTQNSIEATIQATDDEEPVRTTRNGTFARRSPRPNTSNQSAESDNETDSDNPDQAFVPNDADLEPPTPAPPRNKKPSKSRTGVSHRTDQARTSTHSKRDKNAFPITTYQLANPSALPVIPEERAGSELNASDSEGLAASRIPPALQSSSLPNPIDVLSQTAHEVILSAINNLSSTDLQLSTSKLKQLKQALQSFRSTLMNNLLTLSTTHTHKQTLESRVRKSAREKADLQARWLEVRRQRDMLDLKKDRIRREHWEAEAHANQAWEISESARKVDLALDGDTANSQGESDLEFTLRSLAEDVSCSGKGYSILDRVRGLNELLEEVAGNLDVR